MSLEEMRLQAQGDRAALTEALPLQVCPCERKCLLPWLWLLQQQWQLLIAGKDRLPW